MTDLNWRLQGKRYEKYSFEKEINRQLAELKPDNFTAVLYIAKDYIVMLACALAVIHVSFWLYPIAVLLIGAHQRGLTTVAHDSAHRILATNKRWNVFLGVVFAAYPLFQKHYAYKVSHVYLHHPHLGDPERDPDLRFFLNSGVYEVRHPIDYLLKIVVWPVFGGATINYLTYLWQNRFSVTQVPESHLDARLLRRDTIGFCAFWLIVIGASVALGLFDELLLFWVIPYLTVFQILGWFIEIAEHSPMCETQESSIYLTRNRKGNLIERVLFGVNLDEYHLEHHLSPGIPFWHLKRAQEIRKKNPAYAKVADTWGGLFVAGPEGQKSVMRQLLERNDVLYWASHDPAMPFTTAQSPA